MSDKFFSHTPTIDGWDVRVAWDRKETKSREQVEKDDDRMRPVSRDRQNLAIYVAYELLDELGLTDITEVTAPAGRMVRCRACGKFVYWKKAHCTNEKCGAKMPPNNTDWHSNIRYSEEDGQVWVRMVRDITMRKKAIRIVETITPRYTLEKDHVLWTTFVNIVQLITPLVYARTTGQDLSQYSFGSFRAFQESEHTRWAELIARRYHYILYKYLPAEITHPQ